MIVSVGTPSTRTWRVEYTDQAGEFQTQQIEGLSAEVTEGGVLIFRNLGSDVCLAIGPSGWTEVTPL